MGKTQQEIQNEVIVQRCILDMMPHLNELSEILQKGTFEIGYGRITLDFDCRNSEAEEYADMKVIDILNNPLTQ